ncbi:MAG: response regulator transcription factor [Bacteroidota bacterium]
MAKGRILIAEDDESLGFVIQDGLAQEGYAVVWSKNGEDAWELFEQGAFDLCVLDVMMPRLDGFELAQRIRTRDEFVPILFLTALEMEDDRLRAFEIGGDDYVTKPFSLKELVYRIAVFMRRSGSKRESGEFIQIGGYQLDLRNLKLTHEVGEITLTQMEAKLLHMLCERSNDLVKREDILIRIWGENDYFKGRSLDVFISRLRKYLRHDTTLSIENHHGVGFTLRT